MKIATVFKWVCAGVLASLLLFVLAGYCMFKLWSDAYFTDDELFWKAEETVLSEGVPLQKLADEVFASWKSLERDGE